MNREQRSTKRFVAAHEMVNIGTSVIFEGVAVAADGYRGKIGFETGVFEVDTVFFGTLGSIAETPNEGVAMAGKASRRDAIKDVYAAGDAFYEVNWFSYAHKIAELVLWQIWDRVIYGFIHVIFTLVVVGNATYGIAIKTEFDGFYGRPLAQILVRAALDNTKERLVRVFVGLLATLGPS